MKNYWKKLGAVIITVGLAMTLSSCYIHTGIYPYGGCYWVPGHYGPYGGWHPGHWVC